MMAIFSTKFFRRKKQESMMVTKEIQLNGKTFSLETGRFAKQAHGAVMVRYGDTMVLATVVSDYEAKEGQDFFPLQVEYP